MMVFRHADPRVPFFWEDERQPAGRWHHDGEGPVQYVADTPDGAWAELLRHEEITDPADLLTIRRALWAIEIDDADGVSPKVPMRTLTGGVDSYGACRAEAARLRALGARRIEAPSAALTDARPFVVHGGLHAGPARTPRTLVLFGLPNASGWRAAAEGRPHPELLPRVRRL
ncbi:MAG: RES domain-containing protein [Vicinamibacterales bacterium]